MKKTFFKIILFGSTFLLTLAGCGKNQPTSSSTTSTTTSSSSSTTSHPHEYSQPEFSQSSYSYDKNVGKDLEMPVELNGVNVYSVYFNEYKLTSKQYEYNEAHKTLNIKELFMTTVEKGSYPLYVIFDEEVNPVTLDIIVMNSVITRFDTSTKYFEYGRTGDLVYECDFSTANITKLMKGDIVIPEKFYKYENKQFTLTSALLDRLCGDVTFELFLSNNDNYKFTVSVDTLFFTDYDITTIHSEVESIYGANPLYQYASSDHVSLINAEQYGMEGRALKYIPNTVDVELDCHGIMTLADTETGMSWYKVGYTKNGTYLIEFDYQTIGSSDKAGQTFQFASVTNWGAPFNYSQDLLLGPSNDGIIHHFSVVLTGEQIKSGTLIFAKWLGGSGFLLIDNFRVNKVNYPFIINNPTSYRMGDGDYEINLEANGWKYQVYVDNELVETAQCLDNKVILPSTFMDTLSAGEHNITFATPVGKYSKTFNIISGGTASFTETSKTFTNSSIGLKFAGSFQNVTLTKATKFGELSYDSSNKDGLILSTNDFLLESDGLTILPNILKYIYGKATFKLEFSNLDTFTIFATNTKMLFLSNFNESDVWYHEFDGTATNCLISQDTSMISFSTENQRQHLVYEPKNATLPHSKTPGTFQNGFFTFKRNDASTAGTNWAPLNYTTGKNYRLTIDYSVEGNNSNTKLILYRWLGGGSDDRTLIIDPTKTTFSYDFEGGNLAGFYLYCSYTASNDVLNYKVNVYSLSVEEI